MNAAAVRQHHAQNQNRWRHVPQLRASRSPLRARVRQRPRPTIWCCRPSVVRRMVRRLAPTQRAYRRDGSAVSSTLTFRCVPMWVTSLRSATSSGQPMLAHKAVHEAHVAAEVIAGELQGNADLACSGFQRPGHSERRLHRSGGGVGWPDRRPSQSPGHQSEEGPVPVDAHRAARSPMAVMRASPSSCLMTRPRLMVTVRFWAAAWSVRMRGT